MEPFWPIASSWNTHFLEYGQILSMFHQMVGTLGTFFIDIHFTLVSNALLLEKDQKQC